MKEIEKMIYNMASVLKRELIAQNLKDSINEEKKMEKECT